LAGSIIEWFITKFEYQPRLVVSKEKHPKQWISLMKDNGTDGGKNHRFPKPDDQEATQSLRFLAAGGQWNF
jgi:hypothetical protein